MADPVRARDGSRMAETASGGFGSRQRGPKGAPYLNHLSNDDAFDHEHETTDGAASTDLRSHSTLEQKFGGLWF